ncbi:MAG: hypothetical protein GY796_00900 [Chloroflexi bacterium]|nr:hypothetical protein [Chloroflexota bacterium]
MVAGQLFFLIGLGILMWVVGGPPTVNQITVYILAVLFAIPTFQHALWVFSNKARWRFFFGFGGATAVSWLIAGFFQQGWILDFIQSLGRYIPLPSGTKTGFLAETRFLGTHY